MSHLYQIKSHSQIVIESCLRFSKDHRMLVESSCGSVLKIYFIPEAFEISKKLIIINVYGGTYYSHNWIIWNLEKFFEIVTNGNNQFCNHTTSSSMKTVLITFYYYYCLLPLFEAEMIMNHVFLDFSLINGSSKGKVV